MPPRHSTFKKILFWALALAPLLVLVEVVSYVVLTRSVPTRIRARAEKGSIDFHAAQRRKESVRAPRVIKRAAHHLPTDGSRGSRFALFHSALGWDYPPGIVYEGLDGTIYTHGAMGERRTMTSFPVTSVATYGDSFTYCMNAADDETWQTYLGRALGTNILNFGVVGYGTDQAFLKYRLHRDIDTDLVLLCVWPENINRAVNIYRPFYNYDEPMRLTKPMMVRSSNGFKILPNPISNVWELSLLDERWFLEDLGKRDYWYRLDQRLPRVGPPYTAAVFQWRVPIWKHLGLSLSKLTGREGPVSFPWNLYEEETPSAVMCRLADLFVETARARGSQPIIVMLPHKDDVRELMDYGAARHEPFVAHLKSKGYHYIDAIRAMAAKNPTPERLDSWYHGHAAPAGNRIVAEILAEEIGPLLNRAAGRRVSLEPAGKSRTPSLESEAGAH